MTTDREAWRYAEPTPTSEAWQARWHREWRDRWEHRGKDGWWPVPTAKPATLKRDQVQFFLIIARRAAP